MRRLAFVLVIGCGGPAPNREVVKVIDMTPPPPPPPPSASDSELPEVNEHVVRGPAVRIVTTWRDVRATRYYGATSWRFDPCGGGEFFVAAVPPELERRIPYSDCFDVTTVDDSDADHRIVENILLGPRPQAALAAGHVFHSVVEAALERDSAIGKRLSVRLRAMPAAGIYTLSSQSLMACDGPLEWSATVQFETRAQVNAILKLGDGACHEVTWKLQTYGYHGWVGSLEHAGPAIAGTTQSLHSFALYDVLRAVHQKRNGLGRSEAQRRSL